MKYELPKSHNLSAEIINNAELFPVDDEGKPSLTDVQYSALAAGVTSGKSILAVAPTSTGKTNIAVWSLLSWITNPQNENGKAVYLVSHRALARQKFEEFQQLLTQFYLGGDRTAIVLATGDNVEDGTGSVSQSPLDAPILVATYEKYLGILCGAGIKRDMSQTLVICDEIQILGDKTRGRNVEILLTLLKNSNLGQLIGLSAVIEKDNAAILADWLELELIHEPNREKHLIYECRFPDVTISLNTKTPAFQEETAPQSDDTVEIVSQLYSNKTNLPIVVFCMTIKAVHDCVNSFMQRQGLLIDDTLPLFSGLNEDTESARQLSRLLQHRIAFHTADLLDEERNLVETKLKNGEIDVVFSTTTLAAGVNFPFTTAVFDSWRRWDAKQKTSIPIPNSEFQNMAGRAGRMGLSEAQGKIIFTCDGSFASQRAAQNYLDPDAVPPLKSQLGSAAFEQVVLWLLSCGMCSSLEDVEQFLFSSFNASIEKRTNIDGLSHWKDKPKEVIENLKAWGFVL